MTSPATAISSKEGLRAVYKPPLEGAVRKEISRLDAHCRRFIELSPFVCLGTVDDNGRGDVSPRGGEPGFVHVLGERLLAAPDRPGNNRLDSFTNILSQPGVAMLFLVPGFEETLRVNGRGRITTAPDLMARFVVDGKPPRAVLLVDVWEAQLHCGKAVKRAGLWDPGARIDRSVFPTPGQVLRDHLQVETPATVIDAYVQADHRDNLY